MNILETTLENVKEVFGKKNEINVGFGDNRSYFKITDGHSEAFVVIYDLNAQESDFIELARFFVPEKHRGNGFGKLAAVFIIEELFRKKTEILIDPVGPSVSFWCSVASEFSGKVDFVDVAAPKYIWTKQNTVDGF